jgi:hypothetical protein
MACFVGDKNSRPSGFVLINEFKIALQVTCRRPLLSACIMPIQTELNLRPKRTRWSVGGRKGADPSGTMLRDRLAAASPAVNWAFVDQSLSVHEPFVNSFFRSVLERTHGDIGDQVFCASCFKRLVPYVTAYFFPDWTGHVESAGVRRTSFRSLCCKSR